MAEAEQTTTTQFLLLTVPRSGCHLLDRMLSKQSNGRYLFHPYHNCLEPRLQWVHSDARLSGMSGELRVKHEVERKRGVEVWTEALGEAGRENKILMNHTHPFHVVDLEIILSHLQCPTTTPSPPRSGVIPDATDLLLHPGTVPVFTIRDPRLVVASASRLLGPLGLSINVPILSSVSPIWSRGMYDWLVANGTRPLVVDADDYMTDRDFVRKLCREAGLREDEAWFEWEVGTRKEGLEPHLEPMFDLMQQTLWKSSGNDVRRAGKNRNLKDEMHKWKDEFGAQAEECMLQAVDLQMPHYKYLYERRLKP